MASQQGPPIDRWFLRYRVWSYAAAAATCARPQAFLGSATLNNLVDQIFNISNFSVQHDED